MPRTPRRLALTVIMSLLACPFLLVGAAGAQTHAPIPPQALDGDIPNAETAVRIALAFLSSYSPVGGAGRASESWTAKRIGDTWEVRETRVRGSAESFVVIIDKRDGSILSIVPMP